MQHLKRLTATQFALVACCALIAAGAMLSQGSTLGYVPLVVAVLCGVGAVVKAKADRAGAQRVHAGES
ncbi:MAG: hypothetical protein KA144_02320 [Xanthomonadaceae bacterium]|nr:hypothetical protein [Xanthomonadaceae bacterium]MCC7248461.1 hypothetical protein [Lysobacter sp.]